MKSPQVGNEKMCNHVPQAMASTIVGVGPAGSSWHPRALPLSFSLNPQFLPTA